MPALLVAHRFAERALRAAQAAGILARGLKTQRTERGVLVPVERVPAELHDPEGTIPFEPVEASLEPAEPRGGYKERLDLPPRELALLPGAFDQIGDVVLIRLPEELRPRWPLIGAALLRTNKSARVVCHDAGVEGELRLRSVEVVAGEPRTETEHREHGMRLRVDVARVYFSPRLATERARVAGLVREGERVLDMFAGCGPFSVLIAARAKPSRVVAIDANPDAHRYLAENVRLNKVQGVVEPALGRAEEAASRFAPLDRVIMNLPHDAPRFLPLAARLLADGGVLHHYEVVEATKFAARAEQRRAELATLPGVVTCDLLDARNVRDYAPRQIVLGADYRLHKAKG